MTDNVLPFIPSAVERDVEATLVAAQVYEIGSYGWLNENDADPDFVGHAMWQTDQPYIDHNALFGEAPVQRRPNETEKQILTIGEDFCGLMQASRLSIGLALLWEPHARRNVLNDSNYFWLHHTDAFLKLAIASDRLCDLLVVACTGDKPNVFKNANKQNRKYVTPFAEAQKLLSIRGLNDQRLAKPLALLVQDAADIFANIDRRNSIVHKVATRMAKHVQTSVTALQQQFDAKPSSGFTPKSSRPADWLPTVHARMRELEAEIEYAATELRDWYWLLIKASNNVFQVEYWSRVLGAR